MKNQNKIILLRMVEQAFLIFAAVNIAESIKNSPSSLLIGLCFLFVVAVIEIKLNKK